MSVKKDRKLARIGSIDPLALLELAKVAGYGERTRDRLDYMKGTDWSYYFDAGMRHRLAFWAGENNDPESALCHMAHAAWNDLCVLAYFLHKLGYDDRYYKPDTEESIRKRIDDLRPSKDKGDTLPHPRTVRPSESNLASSGGMLGTMKDPYRPATAPRTPIADWYTHAEPYYPDRTVVGCKEPCEACKKEGLQE